MKIKQIQGIIMQNKKCNHYLAALSIDWDNGEHSQLVNPKHYETEEEVNKILKEMHDDIKSGKVNLEELVLEKLKHAEDFPEGMTVH